MQKISQSVLFQVNYHIQLGTLSRIPTVKIEIRALGATLKIMCPNSSGITNMMKMKPSDQYKTVQQKTLNRKNKETERKINLIPHDLKTDIAHETVFAGNDRRQTNVTRAMSQQLKVDMEAICKVEKF